MNWTRATVVLIAVIGTAERVYCQDIDPVVRLRKTTLGTYFEVNTVFDKQIDALIREMRNEISAQRDRGKFIVHISTPISSRGGGYLPINIEVSGSVKKRLEDVYGKEYLWCVAPGHPIRPGGDTVRIHDVRTIKPRGGEYLYMWTQVIAGEDAEGRDFDMVYFTGPSDFHRYFNVQSPNLIGKLTQRIEQRAGTDERFRKEIAEQPSRRRAFLRYYSFRAGVPFSAGAHDEWNIYVRLNRKRDIGDPIAMFFDGHAVSTVEMDHLVTVGDEIMPRRPLIP